MRDSQRTKPAYQAMNPLIMSIPRFISRFVLLTVTALLLSACGGGKEDITKQQATVDLELLQTLPEQNISYADEVQSVLANRCVVCHGCYDAPCQLKLSSPEGITRGASSEIVYDGARFKTMDPTRLFIDAKTPEEWREKGFHSVLNEGETSDRLANLNNSVMYKMLRLKQLNPQSRVGMLNSSFDLSLNRSQSCPVVDEFDKYAKKFPNQGMPFGMPNLTDEEYRIVVQWLAQGAPVPDAPLPSAQALPQIKQWESFLNGDDNKHRLMSRYIYEHLFAGHLRLEGTDKREFYRLVRSTTPSGEPIDEIPTVRPYNDPGEVYYYRMLRYPADIVAKTHQVYALSEQRLKRYNELFLMPDYDVALLPSWAPEVASNPFETYQAIPPRSRYQFLLDDALFFIEGFIKGPVCRGTIALNVIEDRFWMTFVDPDSDPTVQDPQFLAGMAANLKLPTSEGGDVKMFGARKEYRDLERKYAAERFEYFGSLPQFDLKQSVNYLWDGDGTNPNAALTIYRHYDSASVDQGLIGDYPETSWVVDYPMLERIHYLLVAGYNVFGNVKHQFNTRLYMDFLRIEGEDMFLAFLPSAKRSEIRDAWYQGMREGFEEDLGSSEAWISHDVVVGYQTDDPQLEFYQQMMVRLAPVINTKDVLNRCDEAPCYAQDASADKRLADSAMSVISKVKGRSLKAFPDVAFVRVRRGGEPVDDLAYTVIRDKGYKNVSSFLKSVDENQRDYASDRATVVGWLEGTYPNFFFSVKLGDIDLFAQQYASLETRDDYERFVGRYGVRRTNTNFWEEADWFQAQSLREDPVAAGLFDLNRYQNR